MKRTLSSLIVLATLAGHAAWAQMPALAELEARLQNSVSMRVLDAQYDVARLRLESEQRRQGASLYSHMAFSDNDEVVDVGRSRSYRQLSGGIGVRVPVLGSRLQWLESVSNHELALARQASERELRRRELLRELRKAYATYWSAQQLASLSNGYIEHEDEIGHALALRTRAGLLLDSDRLEFLSGFSLARRDHAVADAERQQALERLRMLVNRPVAEGVALHPSMAPACVPAMEKLGEWAERAPDVQFLRMAMHSSESSHRDSALFPVNAEIRAGYQSSTEWPTNEHGGSAAVTLSFDVPINFMSQRRLQQSAAAAERSQSQYEYELRRAEVEQELRTLLRQRAVLEQSLQFANLRVAASSESMRERQLRAAKLAGDVIEQLQQARLAHYTAAKSAIDAELALALWGADWAMHASSYRCRTRGLYVWSSASTLAQLKKSSSHPTLDQAVEQGITTLLVSLDAQQLQSYQRDAASLTAALQAAHARGLKVELLLGEPSWMLPEHRGQLVDIVKSFSRQPFDGVHLDLEPNQLEHTGMTDQALLRSLLDTLRAVRAVSTLPIDLSLHPRYLTQQLDGRSLGEHLSNAGISVTLMIYVSNPTRVIEIAEPLLARYPTLPIRIALSTEDILDKEESLYHFEAAERARRIEMIEQRLQAANFHGITLQPAATAMQAAAGAGN